jgi:hypothetical protein
VRWVQCNSNWLLLLLLLLLLWGPSNLLSNGHRGLFPRG